MLSGFFELSFEGSQLANIVFSLLFSFFLSFSEELLRLRPKKAEELGRDKEKQAEEAVPDEEEEEEAEKQQQRNKDVGIRQRLESYFGKDDELDDNEKFLKTFLLNQGWIDTEKNRIPSYKEVVVEVSEDEAILEDQDKYEADRKSVV